MLGHAGMRFGPMVALILLAGTLAVTGAEDPATATGPERYDGIVTGINTPDMGIVRFRISLDRYSTDAERKTYLEAIKSKGSDGLAAAMEQVTVGWIQFDQNLRYPVAYAIKFPTDKGETIRVASNRPIAFSEQARGLKSKDYNIGVMEIVMPKEGPGEGSILAAAKVAFNEKGQLEVESLPQNTGPQRVSQVVREKTKKK